MRDEEYTVLRDGEMVDTYELHGWLTCSVCKKPFEVSVDSDTVEPDATCSHCGSIYEFTPVRYEVHIIRRGKDVYK